MAENTDTLEVLKQLAQQVRNATAEGENTAERVGRTLVGIIDHLGDGDSITEGMLDEKLEDYPTKQEVTIAMSRYVTTDFFARLFAPEGEDGAEVDVNDMEAVINAVRVKFGLHTDSYISAKGNNPESGSTVSGASALVDLSDVAISNPTDGQILSWNGTKWVNADAPSAGLDEAALAEYLTTNHYAKTTDIPSLEGYATQTWASGQFALKTVAINAGTGLTGGGNLSANRTLSLATVGTAGTYTKVTVDAYGRVTGHASLAAGDIPALAISKITGLQAALDAKMDAADFEELFEKVYVSGHGYAIRAKLALYTDSWMSAKGSNPDAGSVVTGGIDEEELAEYLTMHGYATQSWVNQQGFLKSSALSGYLTQTTADSLYVNVSGDTMTGRLTISTSDNQQLYLNGTSQSQIAFRVNGTTQSLVGYSYTSGAFLQIGSHWINMRSDGTAYVDNEHTIWHSGNDGSGSGLDADLLDGVHLSDIRNGNVYSATRLQTARTLWGQSFNGTANVSGSLSSVTDITMSGSLHVQYGGSNAASIYSNWERGLVLGINGTLLEFTDEYCAPGNDAAGQYDLGLSNRRYGNVYAVNEHLTGTLTVSGQATFNTQSVHNYGILTSMIKINQYLEIGNGRLYWDSANNALYVQKSDGTACGFYATGFVSAKGANDDDTPTEATVLTIADERDATIYPNTYGRGVWAFFRSNNADGLNDGGTYHTVLNIRQWANSSGGLSHQLAFTDNGGVWHRTALSETAWGEWSELSALSGLGDVSISSPTDGQALIYRDGVWKNETVNYGITMDVDWDDVKNKPAWIGSTKPSYSYSEITGMPSISISSSSGTNLSVTVEGSGRTIPDLYATYLGGTTKQGLFTGLTYSSNRLSVTIGGTTRSVTINAGSSGSYLPLSGGTISGDLKVQGEATFNTQSVHNYGILTSNIYTNQSMYVRYNGSNTARIYCNWASGMIISVDGANTEFTNTYIATGTSTASAFDLGISNRRWRTIYSVNSLNASSDLRLKDVRAAIPLTVAQVAAAPSFLYRWKKGADTALHAGSSAQYWQQALPQAVTEGADGYLAMEYDRIALAAAIATARAVADHETRIRRLEQQLDKTPASTP